MNRKEAEDFVYKSYQKAKQHQDYYAKDANKRRPDLTREIIRSKAKTPCVLVTGSKGKGSVAHMISQIMQTTGRVGLMTSPHISDFCERFQIDGVPITEEDFASYMTGIQGEIEGIDQAIPAQICVSPMGIQADLALSYFNGKGTDFNIFECGKGAKFDDVNNVLHSYAVINRIFLEHTRELGDTLKAIAEDKAHVITGEQKCVFVAEQTEEVMEVIRKRAKLLQVPIKVYGADFFAKNIRYTKEGMLFDVDLEGTVYEAINIPLMGEHQAKNCALAMALCKEVLGGFDMERVREQLKDINWPGRMEVLSREPFVLLDACINAESCANVKAVLRHLNIEKATVLIGIPDDKDFLGVIASMHAVAENILLTKSNNPHYVFTDMQWKKAEELGIQTIWVDALDKALLQAKEKGLPIVILGTTSLVSEVKRIFA